MSLATAVDELRHLSSATRVSLLRCLLRVDAWLDARASRRALYQMDERTLADIGLSHPDFADRR
jgi:uncharacterized protein YjiS (DUF1127 family)